MITRASILFLSTIAANAGAAALPPCDPPTANPLAPFERLVGGEWELDGTRQRYEWSLDKTLLKNQSWFDGKLLTEGHWFWHPTERTIKGHFVAIDMPVVVFEYETCFAGDTIVNKITGHSAQGEAMRYEETSTFKSSDSYQWELFQGGSQPVMEGRFHRRQD